MGDAGPPTPPPVLDAPHPGFTTTGSQHPPLREVKVLVTGFGVGSLFLFPAPMSLAYLEQS